MKPSSRLTAAVLLLAGLSISAAGAQRAPAPTSAPRAAESAPRPTRVQEWMIHPRPVEAPMALAAAEALPFVIAIGDPDFTPVAPLEPTIALPPMEPLAPMPAIEAVAVNLGSTRPRASWAPADTADSLYRGGRDALNRSEYRSCARIFRELRERHPRSQYAADASYWEAFCLYRIGTLDDLRASREVLRAAQSQRFSQGSMQADAVALAGRVRTALARRGDQQAIDESRNAAGQLPTCDAEEISVRVEALSALASTDDQLAQPAIRKVLTNRDECTRELRARAISILVRKPDSSALPILLDVIRNDSESQVRRAAVQGMARVPGGRADQALQEVLRTSSDEQVQMAAVSAMGQRDDWRGLRALIERNDVSLELRRAAINGISRERSTPEDAEWLRTFYGRVSDASLKESIVGTVGRLGGETNEQWLVNIARGADEPSRARTAAIRSLARSKVAESEFIKIYDASSERSVREYIVRLLGERGGPTAVDKLIDIVRTGTDPVVRRSAINALSRHRDSNPKVRQLFEDLIG